MPLIYRLTFSARKVGALGIWSTFTETVEADDQEHARRWLYEKYEHISLQEVGIVPSTTPVTMPRPPAKEK